MTFQAPSPHDVDSAVQAVLAEMFPVARHAGAIAHFAKPGVEVFSGTLLSLRHAEILSPRIVEVLIAPGTVVTPLARDVLKRRGVSIRFVARSEVARLRNAGEWGFAIESERNRGLLEALRRGLLDGSESWFEVGSQLDDAMNWVTEAEGRGAMLLTDEASVAVFRACRNPGVRASAAVDVDSVSRATRLLGVNLLIVEPAGKSIALMHQLGRALRRFGGPLPPEWLKAEGSNR